MLQRMAEATDAGEMVDLARKAQIAYERALQAGGQAYKNKYVFYGLGAACMKRREYVDANRWFQKAVNVDKKFVPALLGLAESHQMNRNWVEAIVSYDKAYTHCIEYYGTSGKDAAESTRPDSRFFFGWFWVFCIKVGVEVAKFGTSDPSALGLTALGGPAVLPWPSFWFFSAGID